MALTLSHCGPPKNRNFCVSRRQSTSDPSPITADYSHNMPSPTTAAHNHLRKSPLNHPTTLPCPIRILTLIYGLTSRGGRISGTRFSLIVTMSRRCVIMHLTSALVCLVPLQSPSGGYSQWSWRLLNRLWWCPARRVAIEFRGSRQWFGRWSSRRSPFRRTSWFGQPPGPASRSIHCKPSLSQQRVLYAVPIPNPKNTGRGAIPTFFGYHHIQLCGVSLSTAWDVHKADTSISHATLQKVRPDTTSDVVTHESASQHHIVYQILRDVFGSRLIGPIQKHSSSASKNWYSTFNTVGLMYIN
jgi:hypothetical protein